MKHFLLLLSFITLTNNLLAQKETGTVTDIDGNTYLTVKIGDQWWMAENLRVTHYNDGTAIPYAPGDSSWMVCDAPAFCWYNDDKEWASSKSYGALYNWYAVKTEKLAPKGWHVPSDAEWTQLKDHLKARYHDERLDYAVVSKTSWNSSNLRDVSNNPATYNRSGLSLVPGGHRLGYYDEDFYNEGVSGSWWSSTTGQESDEYDKWPVGYALGCYMYCHDLILGHNETRRTNGFSVRCVKD